MKILFYAVWAVLLAVLQPTLIQCIAVFDIAPNTFLIFVILAGYLRGRTEGAAAGLAFGLVYDLLVGKMMGFDALLFMYAGLGAGILGEKFFGDTNVWMIALTTAAASLVIGFLYGLTAGMVYGNISFYTGFVRTVLPETVYNGLFCILMYFPVRFASRLVKKRTAY